MNLGPLPFNPNSNGGDMDVRLKTHEQSGRLESGTEIKYTSEIQELAPPHSIHGASKAMELARIWIVDENQHVSISGNLWRDPAAWGLMLVDLAKHILRHGPWFPPDGSGTRL